ncbi:hypothetical protein IPC444_13605 [Pseudomonas aeruginosa]|nr:hypothetical protein IPC444_13605 [Pseudomonas aeruginosa]
MALSLKHLLPSRDTALHASWITLTVLVLLLSAAVLMTMGRLKETGAYWQWFEDTPYKGGASALERLLWPVAAFCERPFGSKAARSSLASTRCLL